MKISEKEAKLIITKVLAESTLVGKTFTETTLEACGLAAVIAFARIVLSILKLGSVTDKLLFLVL